jgi:hypothetical protein
MVRCGWGRKCGGVWWRSLIRLDLFEFGRLGCVGAIGRGEKVELCTPYLTRSTRAGNLQSAEKKVGKEEYFGMSRERKEYVESTRRR